MNKFINTGVVLMMVVNLNTVCFVNSKIVKHILKNSISLKLFNPYDMFIKWSVLL
jgi:ABC-type uncharacterized transport system permease subunit